MYIVIRKDSPQKEEYSIISFSYDKKEATKSLQKFRSLQKKERTKGKYELRFVE